MYLECILHFTANVDLLLSHGKIQRETFISIFSIRDFGKWNSGTRNFNAFMMIPVTRQNGLLPRQDGIQAIPSVAVCPVFY